MKKTTLSALSLIIALSAGSAFAEDKPLPPKDGKPPHERAGGPMFKGADTDSDGGINKAEWIAKSEKAFAEIDANKDGKLTPDEMKAHHEQKREAFKERREEFKEKMEERKEKREELRKELGDKKPAPDAVTVPEKH